MKIGLIDIEPKIFNTAYMQIARYYKLQGDIVEWWSPLTDRQFDKVYCSSLFNFTNKSEIPKRTICGGTGFTNCLSFRLPHDVERCYLDYNIYPECDRSFIWFSRGCIRDCPWCVVQEKEGMIRPAIPKPLNPKGKYIVVQDNNFFANPVWRTAVKWLHKANQPVDFQGVDVRLLTEEMGAALNSLKHYKQIKIAWDEPKEDLKPKLREVLKDIPAYKLMCYVLVGFCSTEKQDLHRVEALRELKIDPFVMPFDKKDLYQRAFARWVNHKAIFKKVKWEDYRGRVMAQEKAGTGWNLIF